MFRVFRGECYPRDNQNDYAQRAKPIIVNQTPTLIDDCADPFSAEAVREAYHGGAV